MAQAAKPRVLVVDDIPDNVEVLGEALINDYEVQFANSGAEALALVTSDPPDLIFLDVMMPDMDGYEVCRQLKSAPATQHIPVIFVTAKDTEDDEVFGLNLGAADYISKPFNPAIVRLRARTHITLKQHADMLASLAMIDALTHLPNRRRFDQQLQTEFLRAQREATPLSLLMIDIDFFKQYNDHYGHGGGDICLQKVAAAMAQVIQRPSDLLARLGGEEFVVILAQTDAPGAALIAQRLCTAVEQQGLIHADSSAAPVVTVSVGCATKLPGNAISDAGALLASADAQLYRAKASGRNRIACAPVAQS
ncbi:diguanylate cyclase [Rhodoferax sp. U2-2l]|uniref:diguanylate cyclase n=1 Tax=Rhodoferax sp. U2-2l TaxID=2884000 RepID=UPI001D0A97BE|nr:diguanylate cyclase [Rhodoferax sp. U2-2l]MCB8746773.1 diguanylate cyclase [Rhodoferax sp. U2-2l]